MISVSKTQSPDARKQLSGSSAYSSCARLRKLARISRRKAICAASSLCFCMSSISSSVNSTISTGAAIIVVPPPGVEVARVAGFRRAMPLVIKLPAGTVGVDSERFRHRAERRRAARPAFPKHRAASGRPPNNGSCGWSARGRRWGPPRFPRGTRYRGPETRSGGHWRAK